MRNKTLCLIPARGGSVRFPRKNIAPLKGKPLISYTIEAAMGSLPSNDIYVSTDDEQIAEVARMYPINVIADRPLHLSDSKASNVDVALHTLSAMESAGKVYDYIVILQPTSPLRLSVDIDNAMAELLASQKELLVSVTENEHPPFWSCYIKDDGSLETVFKDDHSLKSQDYPKTFMRNGAVTIGETERFKKQRSFMASDTIAYIMPQGRSIDIDTEDHIKLAELYMDLATVNQEKLN